VKFLSYKKRIRKLCALGCVFFDIGTYKNSRKERKGMDAMEARIVATISPRKKPIKNFFNSNVISMSFSYILSSFRKIMLKNHFVS